jgi:hypothetical protein
LTPAARVGPILGTAHDAHRAAAFADWYLDQRTRGGKGKRSHMPARIHARRPYPDLSFLGLGYSRVVVIGPQDVVYKITVRAEGDRSLGNLEEFKTIQQHWPSDMVWPATLWSSRVLAAPYIEPLFCEAHYRRTRDCKLNHQRRVSMRQIAALQRADPVWFENLPAKDWYHTNFGMWQGRLYSLDLQV